MARNNEKAKRVRTRKNKIEEFWILPFSKIEVL